MQPRVRLLAGLIASWSLLTCALTVAQSDAPPPAAKPDAEAKAGGLAAQQKQVADRFRELEKLLLRMAELTAPTDPRRAALLRQAVAQSKQRDIDHQFDELVELLEQQRLAVVVKNQGEVHQDLTKLLELLLSEDRSKRIESEKERIRQYLKRVNKIIKEQKGIQGETSREGDPRKLADRQGDLSEKTGELAKDLDRQDAAPKPEPDADKKPDGDKKESKPADKSDKSDKAERPADGDKKDGDKKDGDEAEPGKQGDKKQKDDKKREGESPDKRDKSDERSGRPQEGPDKPSQGEPKPGEAQPPSDDVPPAEPGESGKPSDNPAQKRVEQAQQRMKEAQQKLDDAQRDDAVDKQAEALKELEQAKAELEEILRQLREEEMSRTLAMLESRFRKMRALQIEVYDDTKRLDAVPEEQRTRDTEIEAGRLSRKEKQISSEADRALAVLREEGSAVAFPEAVSEMREDMEQVATRLAQAKVGEMTQGVEKDIIDALEEMIVALQKAQKNREQKPQQGDPPQGGEGDEPPLVDRIAELKMIRALQMRVNVRTQRYAEMTKTEQAETNELLDALKRLGEREQQIHRVTRDIVVGRNR